MKATRWVDENNEPQRRAEWEANWFAASLLMPRQQLYTYSQVLGINPDRLSTVFAVSKAAMFWRIKNIGLVPTYA